MRRAVVLVALLAGSCDFLDTAPPGAVILCVEDADCPSAQVCNTAVHECVPAGTALDVLAPAILAVAFSPLVVSDAPVELLITADEALQEAPGLTFAGVDPGFVLSDLTGPTARFLLDSSTVPAGAYPLDAVTLVDLTGNAASRLTPGVTLIVDRDAPTILALEVGHVDLAATGLPFSAQPGSNALQVTFLVDEAVSLEDVIVTAGPVAATCVGGGGLSFVCTATVTSAFNDGTDRVSVTASDGAGNEGEAFANIATDLRPPRLLDSVTVLRRPGSAFAVGAALAGGALEVDIVVDEPLAEPPTFALTGDVTLTDVTVTLITPVRVRLAAVFDVVGSPGDAALDASVRDLVGNTTVLALPSIPLGAAVVAPCPPLVAGTTCVDVDGDGDFAITAGCAGAADCDDTDPTTHGSAAELPGDGIDNDCLGDGDLPIDETVGVFARLGAPAGGDGSRAAPAASFDAARALLAGRGWVFLADDGGSNYNTGVLRVSVLGGLDENWQRQPTVRSDLDVDGFADPTGTAGLIVMDSKEVRNDIGVPMTADVRLTFVRSELPSDLVMRERIVAVDARTHPLTIDPFVVGSLVSRSIIAEALTVSEGSDVTVIASDMEDFNSGGGDHILALAGSRVEVVNSLIATIACTACTLRVTHSVVVGLEDLPQLIGAQGTSSVELRNNIFTWLGAPSAPGATAVRSDGTGALVVLNNLFHAPAVAIPPAVVAAATFPDVTALDGCAPASCAESGGNRSGDPLFGAQRGHIEATSPAVDGAAATYDGLPTALALDIDGDCRTPGTADIGVDER